MTDRHLSSSSAAQCAYLFWYFVLWRGAEPFDLSKCVRLGLLDAHMRVCTGGQYTDHDVAAVVDGITELDALSSGRMAPIVAPNFAP